MLLLDNDETRELLVLLVVVMVLVLNLMTGSCFPPLLVLCFFPVLVTVTKLVTTEVGAGLTVEVIIVTAVVVLVMVLAPLGMASGRAATGGSSSEALLPHSA